MEKIISNNLLSIVIPTFNRSDLLDYTLGHHIPIARKNNINIFIFDNASNDETEKIVKKRINEYPLLHYYRHEKNIGPDSNFEFALKYPKTDYIWLLGDTYFIQQESIEYLLKNIENDKKKYDMFLLNVDNLIKEKPPRDYSDKNELLSDLFWLTNCMSCLIYGRDLIKNANFIRYRDTYFIQSGIIFEYVSEGKFNIKWIPSLSVKTWDKYNELKKVGWQKNIFKIWFESRTNFILSLPPSYDLKIKLKLVRETHVYSKTSLKNLLIYRAEGVLDYSIYKKYKYLFRLVFGGNLLIYIISFSPRKILQLAKNAKDYYSR